ncbi:MAG: hypothetical protein IH987_07425 [Planctomycetes bacterium]|nr:hypothetical protein [Planctomycetota bacterium]
MKRKAIRLFLISLRDWPGTYALVHNGGWFVQIFSYEATFAESTVGSASGSRVWARESKVELEAIRERPVTKWAAASLILCRREIPLICMARHVVLDTLQGEWL